MDGPSSRVVDLRSDTLTQPTPEMREAIRDAAVGDDVFGEDPTVNALEALAAERMGKEAAVFVPSGTMANQVAIFTHSRRPGELVLEQDSHIMNYESGSPALLSGVTVRPLPGTRGVFTAEQLGRAVRPANVHNAPTTLVAIENTHNRASGAVWTPSQTRSVARVAHDHRVPVHLDGARIFNSAIAQEIPVTDLTRDVDSVMFCVSKGLSAPVGSLLCGPAEFIQRARYARKAFGGAMRQAGILAAAGLVAIQTMVDRLREDHANARRLAAGLAKLPGLGLDLDAIQTNIVIFNVDGSGRTAAELVAALGERGVKCSPRDASHVRMVTHRHVTREDIDYTLAEAGNLLGAPPRRTRQPVRLSPYPVD